VDTGCLKERDKTSFSTAEILYRSESSSTSRIVLLTLYSVFHEVLSTMLVLHQAVVRIPTEQEPISQRILGDSKYASYFKDCVGALDGTHIDVYISGESSVPYRNRKGTLTQNVLVVCDFELQFRYVLAGWEGSAHDMRVLRDAARELKARRCLTWSTRRMRRASVIGGVHVRLAEAIACLVGPSTASEVGWRGSTGVSASGEDSEEGLFVGHDVSRAAGLGTGLGGAEGVEGAFEAFCLRLAIL
jgi:hypothetical protein